MLKKFINKKPSRPMMKPMLLPYLNEDKTGISIGGFQHGIARDIIVDNPEDYLTFFKFLDGKHTIAEIQKEFDISTTECIEILNSLLEEGLIYENDFKVHCFCEEEVAFYHRNLNYFAWIDTQGRYYNYWDVQKKLKESKVLVLGAGGTGGNCSVSLARMGVGTIDIVDFDIVEISNLNRQFFFYDDIGQLKVDSLKKNINRVNPFVQVNIHNQKIHSIEDILCLGYDYDVLICCIDKPNEINEIIENYTKQTAIPVIMGGYASTIISNSIYKNDSTSFAEILKKGQNHNFDAKQATTNLYWEWDNAVVAPVANISGNFSSLYAMYYLTDLQNLKYSYVHHVDLFNIQNDFFSYVIDENGKEKEKEGKNK